MTENEIDSLLEEVDLLTDREPFVLSHTDELGEDYWLVA